MATGNFHGVFEPSVYKQFVHNVGKGNVRKKLEEFMVSFNAQQSGDVDEISIEELNIDIHRLENTKTRIITELESKVAIRDRIKESLENKRKMALEAERERIQNAMKCLQCGKVMKDDHTTHSFDKGIVCNSCFLGANKEKLSRWKDE